MRSTRLIGPIGGITPPLFDDKADAINGRKWIMVGDFQQ